MFNKDYNKLKQIAIKNNNKELLNLIKELNNIDIQINNILNSNAGTLEDVIKLYDIQDALINEYLYN